MTVSDPDSRWPGLRPQLVAIHATGLSVDEVASATGITESELVGDTDLGEEVGTRLWRVVAEQSGEPAIALRAAEAVPFGAFDLLDYISGNTPTVADCLNAIAKYFRTLRAALEVTVSHDPNASVVRLHCPASFNADLRRYTSEFTFACIVGRLRSYVGRPWSPELLRWAHASPDYVREYEEFFGCPMLFEFAGGAFVVSAEARGWAIPDADVRLRALLERSADQLYRSWPVDDNWTTRVRKVLVDGLSEREARLEIVAKQLKTSARTLRRQLEREGTSFQQELDVVRAETATGLLLQRDTTVAEVADALGFTDVRAFTRAFRRWTGAAPAAWRRKQKGLG